MAQFNSLPSELLIEIFSYLTWQDHGDHSRVCRKWNSLVIAAKHAWVDVGIDMEAVTVVLRMRNMRHLQIDFSDHITHEMIECLALIGSDSPPTLRSATFYANDACSAGLIRDLAKTIATFFSHCQLHLTSSIAAALDYEDPLIDLTCEGDGLSRPIQSLRTFWRNLNALPRIPHASMIEAMTLLEIVDLRENLWSFKTLNEVSELIQRLPSLRHVALDWRSHAAPQALMIRQEFFAILHHISHLDDARVRYALLHAVWCGSSHKTMLGFFWSSNLLGWIAHYGSFDQVEALLEQPDFDMQEAFKPRLGRLSQEITPPVAFAALSRPKEAENATKLVEFLVERRRSDLILIPFASDERTVLDVAVALRQRGLAKALLEQAGVRSQLHIGLEYLLEHIELTKYPFWEPIRTKKMDFFQYVMAHEADIDTPNIARLLFQNRPLFRSLLSKISVSSLSTWDRTIIHDAIRYAMPLRETLEMLRQADKLPSLAQTNKIGLTAVEYAATCQALESVTILLSYGSPPGRTSYILSQKLHTVGDKAWCKQAKKIVSSVFTQQL